MSEKSTFIKVLSFCLFMFLFTVVPSLNVKPETNKNFFGVVGTDKTEYSYVDEVTYKVIVKNTSGKEGYLLTRDNTRNSNDSSIRCRWIKVHG